MWCDGTRFVAQYTNPEPGGSRLSKGYMLEIDLTFPYIVRYPIVIVALPLLSME